MPPPAIRDLQHVDVSFISSQTNALQSRTPPFNPRPEEKSIAMNSVDILSDDQQKVYLRRIKELETQVRRTSLYF